MEKMIKYSWLVLGSMLIGATFSACSSAEEGNEEEVVSTENVLELSAEQIDKGGIQFGQIVQQEFNAKISVNGRVTSLPGNEAQVSAYFSGNVVDIAVVPGQQVNKGDQLFVLENPAFIKVQEEYLMTRIEEENLKIEYERQKGLSTENITSLKAFQTAEKDLLLAQTKLAALSNELKLMNINASKLDVSGMTSKVSIYAPITGVVAEVTISLGGYITSEVSTMNIVGEGGKVLEFEVFEKHLAAISEENKIHFRIGNDPYVYEADILHVLPMVQNDSKSVKIYAQPTDPSVSLISGMYVGGEIQSMSTLKWSLPANAVVKDGDQYYVWLKTKAGEQVELTKMYVELGISENGFVEILNQADFAEGAEVVTKGAFNL